MFETLPLYALYIFVSLVMMSLFTVGYVMITPWKEFSLIREGNMAAALSFVGFQIGLALPLKSVASGTYSILEYLAWGGIAFLCQLLVVFVSSVLIPGLKEKMNQGIVSCGILVGGFSIAVGVVNAGALSY